MKVSATCVNCDGSLHEGRSAYYDEEGNQHFCTRSCFTEWHIDNIEKLAMNYWNKNIERVDL